MAVNKVDVFGQTVIDLTNDDITPESLLKGVTAHNKGGEPITGTMSPAIENRDYTMTQKGWHRIGESSLSAGMTAILHIVTQYRNNVPNAVALLISTAGNAGSIRISQLHGVGSSDIKVISSVRVVSESTKFSVKSYIDVYYNVDNVNSVMIQLTRIGARNISVFPILYSDYIFAPEAIEGEIVNEYPITKRGMIADYVANPPELVKIEVATSDELITKANELFENQKDGSIAEAFISVSNVSAVRRESGFIKSYRWDSENGKQDYVINNSYYYSRILRYGIWTDWDVV